MFTRRTVLAAAVLGVPALSESAPTRPAELHADLAALEQANGGRLGVAIIDTASGETTGHREDERFAMCSTFKFMLASAVLRKTDRKAESLSRELPIPALPSLSHSPVTDPHAGAAMTVAQLCQAVVVQSDNTAANLLLGTLGGPPGITLFARSIGDSVTRLDRTELDLNEALAGDPRDTTSPLAMACNLRRILLGTVLSAPSQERLTAWMVACETGLDRLRARMPARWRAADKTGSNGSHTSNDIALLWPPGRSPLIVTAYLTQCFGPERKRAALLASVGDLVMKAYGQSPT